MTSSPIGWWGALAVVAWTGAACVSLGDLPVAPPPLVDMEEPLSLFVEPDDEDQRLQLDRGLFTGVCLAPTSASLEQLFGDEVRGLEVAAIVENSPAAAAGLRPGDLLLSVGLAGAVVTDLVAASQWRKLELDVAPGEAIEVTYDRANTTRHCALRPVPRLKAPERVTTARLREERRAGFVVRTATEVEARAAGLGPGGGAVIVGLARRSPWRNAGIEFGDLLVAVDGSRLHHPQVLLQHLRETRLDQVCLRVFRDGELLEIEAPLAVRGQELQKLSLWPVFSHASRGERSETMVLLGLFGWEISSGGWRIRLFWLLSFGGGDTDRLSVEEPGR